MREIRLASKQYKILGDIVQRAINPWKAQVTSGGTREYSSFSSAETEEYHDFRNGIGLESERSDESNRLSFTEGIDFSTARSSVLGSLVNTTDYVIWVKNTAYTFLKFIHPTTANGYCYECTTEGTSHATTEPIWGTTVGATTADGTVTWTCRNYLAPIKLIDFESKTYVIQDNRILRWNTSTLVWDVVWNYKEVCDCDDIWTSDDDVNVTCSVGTNYKEGTGSAYIALGDGALVGNIAHRDITAVDISGYTKLSFWIYSSITLTAGQFTIKLYSTTTTLRETLNVPAVPLNTWTKCEATLATPANDTAIDLVRLYQAGDVGACGINLDWFTGGVSLTGAPIDTIVATDATDSYLVVSSALDAIYTTNGTTWNVLNGCQGYLAWYDTKLRGIATDGNTLYSSATDNVDGTWTHFHPTGNFSVVYDLFEGKLLSDGSPVIYSCGTQGLFTTDTVTEKTYKQEVAYPPLTYSGHIGLYWNANVWVATGYGILKVGSGSATFAGPDLDDGLPSGFQGYIYDMVTVNNWLVFCVNGGTTDKSSILKRNSSLGGNLQVYTTSAVNKSITCLYHSPSSLYTNGRLWFGEGTDVKYMMFPDVTSNVKQIATYEYVDDSGYGKLPILRKLATISKTALGVAAITKSCSATDYIEVFYGLNGAAPTTSLGTFISSPKPTTLTFGSGLGTEFYTIQFAIKLYRGATITNSPELESLMFYYLPTLETINGWLVPIEAIGENGNQIFTEFETIRDTKTLVAFYPSGDSAKTSYNVKLTTMPSREWWENRGQREGYFQVDLQEIFNG